LTTQNERFFPTLPFFILYFSIYLKLYNLLLEEKMKKMHAQLLTESKDLWVAILQHPFLQETAGGKISDHIFKTWMQQDYIFVREAIPFAAVLLAKAPEKLRSNFIQILTGLDQELRLFRKNAQAQGVNLENIQATPTCHSYLQFLMTTAYNCSFTEGFTVLYSAEKIYLDSWMEVKKKLKEKSPWEEFINNWTSQGFQQYVDWLAVTLDELTENLPERELNKIRDLFQITAKYEYLFWKMAYQEEKWPPFGK
jgi:thiaminase